MEPSSASGFSMKGSAADASYRAFVSACFGAGGATRPDVEAARASARTVCLAIFQPAVDPSSFFGRNARETCWWGRGGAARRAGAFASCLGSPS